MDLYICEKQSQASDLAVELNASKKNKGFFHNDTNIQVTWAQGHLLELYMPEEYDDRLKQWSLNTLPITPTTWKNNIKKSSYSQYKVIEGLIKKADNVYIATDLDREGESIARSILERCNYNGPIFRVCLTALDKASIQKALKNIKNGKDTIHLHYAAVARQRADWLVGMNVSRLYTILAREAGFQGTLHVGRVITPTISLICQRDREISNFTPSPYWILNVDVSVQNGQFKARWMPHEDCSDDQGRCINKTYAEQVATQINGSQASISKAETKVSKESPPLPFDLTSLQKYANAKWGYTAQEVLDAAQSLYDKRRAVSYPRTDCRYLPESQKADVSNTLQSLIISDQTVSNLVAGANPHNNSRAFNDKKITAHHGIIPTPSSTDISLMNEIELNLYDAIRRFYIAQFYNEYEFSKTSIEILCGKHTFTASGKVPTKQGWKVLFAPGDESYTDNKSPASEEDLEQDKLPVVKQGEPAIIKQGNLSDKMTRPSPHFTESSLLAAMENISKFVTEEKFKKILKETAGIGTPATRAGIIQGAVDKGYLVRKKKTLIATNKAHSLIAVLPPAIKSPGMTAAWEQELEAIEKGSGGMSVFSKHIAQWICKVIDQLKDAAPTLTKENGAIANAFKDSKPTTFECFNCSGEIRRIKGKYGFFWICRNESCKKTFSDNRGKPEKKINLEDSPECPECKSSMKLKKGKAPNKKRASKFWGCTKYPDCKAIVPYKKQST